MSSGSPSTTPRSPAGERFQQGFLPWAGVVLMGIGSLVAVVAAYAIVVVYNVVVAFIVLLPFLVVVGALAVGWVRLAVALRRGAGGRGSTGARTVTWFGIGTGMVALAVSPALLTPNYYHGPWVAAAWSGLVLVVVGTVLARLRGGRRTPHSLSLPVGVVSGTVVAVLAVAAAWGWGMSRAVLHTTVEAAAPEPIPETVGEVAWTWEAPEDRGVIWGVPKDKVSVDPTAAGVVVETGNGVVALDTATGEETWRYRLAGVSMYANVSADGGTVEIVVVHMGDEGGTRHRSTFLDAATGEALDVEPTEEEFSRSTPRIPTSVPSDTEQAAEQVLEAETGGYRLFPAPGAILAVNDATMTITGLA